MEETGRTIQLEDVTRGLWHRRWLILICTLVTAASALGFSLLQEKQYTAEASLLFRDPGFDQRLFGASAIAEGQDPTRQAATNVRLVSLDIVADRTAAELGSEFTGDEISDQVAIEEQGQSNVVAISATAPDPALAAQMANTFAANYIEFRLEADRSKVGDAIRLVQGEFDDLGTADQADNAGEALQRQISQLRTLQALQTGNAELVQQADAPDEASSPATARNAIVGGILGLLFGVALSLILERLDRRIRLPGDLAETLSLPLLGTVPDSAFLAESPEQTKEPLPFSEAEAFRMLRSRLRYFNVDRDIRSVVVTSAAPNEGKSTVAWNLAMTVAGAGAQTLLIEADLHHPTFASQVGMSPLPGLAEVLTGQSQMENALQTVDVPGLTNGTGERRKLNVLVSGNTPPNPAELLESEEMSLLIERAMDVYDLVILDTPPVTVLADAIPLMRRATGVLVVGSLGQSTRDEATALRDQLQNLAVPVLGVVANRAEIKRGRYGYGYAGSYGEPAPTPREAP